LSKARSFRVPQLLVFNTSTLIVLIELDALHYVRRAVERSLVEVIVPQSVKEELRDGGRSIDVPTARIELDNLNLRGVSEVIDIPRSLGKGEREVIATAYALKGRYRVVVITDDRKARSTCEKLNLEVHGTLWLIKFFRKRGVITREEALEVLKRIENTSLYVGPELLSRVVREISEEP